MIYTYKLKWWFLLCIVAIPWSISTMLFNMERALNETTMALKYDNKYFFYKQYTIPYRMRVHVIIIVACYGYIDYHLPEEFVADFEAALWKALTDRFPGTPIKGCVQESPAARTSGKCKRKNLNAIFLLVILTHNSVFMNIIWFFLNYTSKIK